MVETPDDGRDDPALHRAGSLMTVSEVEAWFVREVLPLEAILMQFLRRNCQNSSDVSDLCQDVYVQVFERARESIPDRPKSCSFSTAARNLLIDRACRRQIILDPERRRFRRHFQVAIDEPGPDRIVLARDARRRLQAASGPIAQTLPRSCRP